MTWEKKFPRFCFKYAFYVPDFIYQTSKARNYIVFHMKIENKVAIFSTRSKTQDKVLGDVRKMCDVTGCNVNAEVEICT